MKKLNEKTEARFFQYIISYSEIINKYWKKLQKIGKNKRSWDINVNNKKHIYFATTNSITLMDKKDHLEMKFTYDFDDDYIYFTRLNLCNFIESDLNVSWLWRNFKSNSILREVEYDECIEILCNKWRIWIKDNWFIISKEELS